MPTAHDGTSEDDAANEFANDPELLEEFVVEGLEGLAEAETALLKLEDDPADEEAIGSVFRSFHTIKGVAGFLDLTDISRFAHHAESFLIPVRDGEVRFDEVCADLSLRCIDMLRELMERVRSAAPGEQPGLPKSYEALLEALADPGALSGTAPRAEAKVEPEPEPDGGRLEVPPSASASGGSREVFVRVRTDSLDRLLDTVGELVIAHAMVVQDEDLGGVSRSALARKVSHSGKIVRELQDLSTSLRMVPMRATFRKMARVARDVARKSNKLVELITEGEDTEVDRNMVDVLADPLVHMLRNACDHGVESPDDRELAGKPRTGVVRLSARHEGGQVVVELSDDGAGLDRERILARAIEKGIVAEGANLKDEEIYALIFGAGFSTATVVTDVSGRGVGMDVVRRGIESLQGRIAITSRLGEGTTFSIYLPLTLSITDGMLLRVGDERYILPTVSIEKSFQPTSDELFSVAGRGELVMLRDEPLPLFRLHRVFGVQGAVEDPTRGLVIVVTNGGAPYGLLVDELLGQHQVVTKSLGEGVRDVEGISGGAILGDGRVGLILDPADIATIARRATMPLELQGAA